MFHGALKVVDGTFLIETLADQDAKRGQVLIGRAEAIAQPRPHRRPPGNLRSCLKEGDRRVVVDRLGVNRADDAEIVGDPGE